MTASPDNNGVRRGAPQAEEVSGRALASMVERATREGVAERLLAGVPVSARAAADPGGWISWESFAQVLENAAGIWSEQELVRFGRGLLSTRLMRPITLIARTFYQPAELYRWIANPQDRGGQLMFRPIRGSCEVESADRVRLTMTLDPDYRCVREFFLISQGVVEIAPTLLGYRAAQVTCEQITRGVCYHIVLPRGGPLAWLRRTVAWPVSIMRAAPELRRVQALLAHRSRELAQEHRLHRRTETDLRHLDEQYRLVTDNAPGLIAYLDGGHVYRFVNPTAAAWFGRPRSGIHGRHMREVHGEAGYAQLRESVARALAGESVSFEVDLPGAEGQPRQLAGQCVPHSDEQSRVVGAVLLCQDVTEERVARQRQRLLEMRLNEVQRLESLGRLAGGVAHDFNNLLQAILANLALANRHSEGRVREYQERALDAVEQARELVAQLLAYGRKAPLARRAVSLDPVVRLAAEMARDAVDRSIDLRFRSDGTEKVVEADSGQLTQVVLNLCLNARDAVAELPDTAGERWIEIRTGLVDGEAGPAVCLSVEDNGVGMDDETRRRALEPFFTTKEVGRGTGLGLSSVDGIMAQHGGRLTIESRPGAGTTIRCCLPLVDARPEERPAREVLSERRGSETLLLIDDDERVREPLVETLEGRGYRVFSAPDGESGLALFERHRKRIDATLLDLSMPGMPGRVVFARMRTLDPAARVIICTGYGLDDQEVVALDADGRLQKPVSEAELLGALDALFGRGGANGR